VSQALAESFGLKATAGALISSVEKGSPAAVAGLEAGDIILKLNDTTIVRSSELPPLVAALKPGTQVKLQVWRKGAPRHRPRCRRDCHSQAGLSGRGSRQIPPRSGAAFPDSGRASAGRKSERADRRKCQRSRRAGRHPGWRHRRFAQRPEVRDVAQLRALLDKAGKNVALLIERDNARIFVPVDLG
jgi:serine protease Do